MGGEKVTDKELNQYRFIKEEIKDLTFRITKLEEKEILIMTDKVKGSSKYFPYTEMNFNVTGVDQDAYHRNQTRIANLKHKREKKRAELLEKESEMHDFIYSIQDSQVRQIFILRFIDGLSQDVIGRKLHMERSTVSKKIAKYLDNQTRI